MRRSEVGEFVFNVHSVSRSGIIMYGPMHGGDHLTSHSQRQEILNSAPAVIPSH